MFNQHEMRATRPRADVPYFELRSRAASSVSLVVDGLQWECDKDVIRTTATNALHIRVSMT